MQTDQHRLLRVVLVRQVKDLLEEQLGLAHRSTTTTTRQVAVVEREPLAKLVLLLKVEMGALVFSQVLLELGSTEPVVVEGEPAQTGLVGLVASVAAAMASLLE